MKGRNLALVMIILSVIVISGCTTQTQREYVCPDGITVSNASSCPKTQTVRTMQAGNLDLLSVSWNKNATYLDQNNQPYTFDINWKDTCDTCKNYTQACKTTEWSFVSETKGIDPSIKAVKCIFVINGERYPQANEQYTIMDNGRTEGRLPLRGIINQDNQVTLCCGYNQPYEEVCKTAFLTAKC